MIRALKWIWEQVCHLGALVASLASSVWTWAVAAIGLIADKVLDWIADGFALIGLTWPELPTDSSQLFSAIVWNFSLDRAVAAIIVVVGLWCASRAARLAMVPIRAVLELL